MKRVSQKAPSRPRTAPAKRSPIVLFGFEPFGGDSINPSAEIVRALDGVKIGSHKVISVTFPVTFAIIQTCIENLLDTHKPSLVIGIGLAGGRHAISLERVAINLIDARIADNAATQPIDEPIIFDAPSAYFSTLPVKAMREKLAVLGIPAELSLSAGSYVCNQAFFVLAHLLATRHATTRGGFIHVPWLPEQALRHASDAALPLATMVEGIHVAIDVALTTTRDVCRIGGALH